VEHEDMSINPQTCVDPYLDSFIASLAAADYKPATISDYRSIIRKIGRLMDAEGVTPSALTLDEAERLGRMVPRKHGRTRHPHTLARRFSQYLIDIGAARAAPPSEAQVARTALLANFETYLINQRGVSPRTVYHTLRFANRFLNYRFGELMINIACLRPTDAIGFVEYVLAGAPRDKTITTHVRVFLQYLFGCGATTTNLALSLPRTTRHWGARLPRHLSPEGVEAVLASVRDNQRHGARDYAMLLLMARLGLRALEVTAIELDDIDWRAGELTVRGKGKRYDRLPITVEVGDALSRYLREERGPTICRRMFVTHRAPHRPFKNSEIVNAILKDALKATGQKPATPYVGSHLLRHSLATQLVNKGASLEEIGDMLRHRSRASTMIYARLDVEGLRSIAQPWPVAGGSQ
jgi:integrase/recombinase XerD